jgi:hypothetical protein
MNPHTSIELSLFALLPLMWWYLTSLPRGPRFVVRPVCPGFKPVCAGGRDAVIALPVFPATAQPRHPLAQAAL